MKKESRLGPWMLIALVTGNMVGSGAFLLPADLARIGSISLIALGVTVIGAMALALVFAKMSLLIPRNGGAYVYAKEVFGEYTGFQTAYYYWIGVWVGNAAVVVAALGYIDILFPVLNHLPTRIVVTLVMIWLPVVINLSGIKLAGAVQIITAVLKFTPLIIVGVLGWFFFNPAYLIAGFNNSGGSNFTAGSSAILLTMWLFIGVESAAVPADLVDNPKRNIPLATLVGTGFAALIYILSNVVIFGLIPTEQLAQATSPFATAVELICGSWGKILVACGAICACFGALNGWVLVAAQVPMSAAEEGFFPKVFAKRNRCGMPAISLVVTSLCITLLILFSTYLNLIEQFEMLILVATIAEVLSYFYTAIAQVILLRKQASTGHKDTLHLLIAIVAAAYSFYAILGTSKEVIFGLTAFLLFTVPLYAILKPMRGVMDGQAE